MSPLEAVRLVAVREARERLQGRVIWITTALMALAVVGAIVIPALVQRPTPPMKIGLVGPAAQAAGPELRSTARALKVSIRIEPVANQKAAKRAVRSGRLALALVLGTSANTALVQQTVPRSVFPVLTAALQSRHQVEVLSAARVPSQVISKALELTPLRTRALSAPSNQQTGRILAAVGSAVLLYVSLLVFGQLVAAGVAQEKTSRAAEILLATLRPTQLLAGKVVGIGACALGQMAVTVGAGLIANAITHSTVIPATTWGLLPAVLLWFALGYALYSMVFAAAGSLVARQEEVSMVTAPLSALLVGAYLLTFAAVADPRAAWVVGLSFVPPLAPILIPIRVALGTVPVEQLLVAAALMLGAIAGLTVVGARIYARAIVHTSRRLGWRSAWRSAR